MNLDRCASPSCSRVGLAQVSVAYIMSAIRHAEEGGQSTSDTRSNKSGGALALPFLLREEALSAGGIDVQSCLHLLFELYAQWLHGGVEGEATPLLVLTEMVRSLLLLTDLFTEVK